MRDQFSFLIPQKWYSLIPKKTADPDPRAVIPDPTLLIPDLTPFNA